MYFSQNISQKLSLLCFVSKLLHRCKPVQCAVASVNDGDSLKGMLCHRAMPDVDGESHFFCILFDECPSYMSQSLQIGNDMCEALFQGTF